MSDLTNVKVGDTVLLRGLNESRQGGPREVTITKVGPKRVAYEEYGSTRYARRDDGRIDDWRWMQTVEEYAAERISMEMHSELRERRWEPRMGHRPSLDELRAVLNALREVQQ